MPFSLLLQGYPTTNILVAHVQGPVLQGVFLQLIREVDPAVNQRLHEDNRYCPYTLSPLGLANQTSRSRETRFGKGFQGFRLPRHQLLQAETPCYLKITLLEDSLFPTFGRYFFERPKPTFRLGDTEFVVTGVMGEKGARPALLAGESVEWTRYVSYEELINTASTTDRTITLHFLTPTSFRRGNVDFPLPDPRLVSGSYQKRFAEFAELPFLENFAEQVEYYTGIARLHHLNTEWNGPNRPPNWSPPRPSLRLYTPPRCILVGGIRCFVCFPVCCGTSITCSAARNFTGYRKANGPAVPMKMKEQEW